MAKHDEIGRLPYREAVKHPNLTRYLSRVVSDVRLPKALIQIAPVLRVRFGSEPSLNDCLWSFLTDEQSREMQAGRFGLVAGTICDMGRILAAEGKYDQAASHFARYIYWGDCGVTNASAANGWRCFNYTDDIPGGAITLFEKAARKAVTDKPAARDLFLSACALDAKNFARFKPLRTPSETWARLEEEDLRI